MFHRSTTSFSTSMAMIVADLDRERLVDAYLDSLIRAH
jgi:hypothetical protein